MWKKILGLQEGDLVELVEEATFLGGASLLETFRKGTRFRVKRIKGKDILLEKRGRLYWTTKRKVKLVE